MITRHYLLDNMVQQINKRGCTAIDVDYSEERLFI
jgi:hypothetical protein